MAEDHFYTVFASVLFQLEKYSRERRATTQPFHLEEIEELFVNYNYFNHDNPVREPLIEHVGSLPVLATILYPHINDPEVNLGDALIMLAIHDIGELEVGDENVFTKNENDGDRERAAALGLLDEQYHSYYLRVETQSDASGKFAKSIDKIAPDFWDYITPSRHTIDRFNDFAGVNTADDILQLVRDYKSKYMSWNPFMSELHNYLLDQTYKKLKDYETTTA